MDAQDYYDSLKPFREAFETGLPILMYHKLGPRPPGVRIKGLYLGTELFERQLAEFHEAKFRASTLDEPLPAAGVQNGAVVLTFDDGFRNVHRLGLGILEKYGMQAIQFLVADRIGKINEWDLPDGEVAEPLMDEVEIREWIAAGHDIGAHSLTHPRLAQIPLARAREEIIASKKKLEDRFGRTVEHFCYPYGDWNDAVRDIVAEAGYKTACTTAVGVNTASTPRLELKRYMARYPSRNLSSLAKGLFRNS